MSATAADDFSPGPAARCAGIRATTRRSSPTRSSDAAAARARSSRCGCTAPRGAWPRRRVLALAIERTDMPNLLPAARDELLRSRHEVTFASAPAGDRGKFENLNALLAQHPAARATTGCWCSTTTSRSRADSSTRSCSWPSALACAWHSPRTAALARRMAGHAPAPAQRRAGDQVRRDRPGVRLPGGRVRGAAAVPALRPAGGSTSTGRRSRKRTAGRSA